MSLRDEIEVYSKAKISTCAGEVEGFDHIIFPNVIRKREIGLVLNLVEEIKPKEILDFGCGVGWLSRLLTAHGYKIVGIDTSSWLIKNAVKLSSHNSPFLVGDCMNLPFRDNSFDLILGVAILHHLNTRKALSECRRVTTKNARLMLMEPNRLSPIAAFGRKVCPFATHTKGEHPFSPRELLETLSAANWRIETCAYLFPYSFALAYLFGKTGWKDNQKLKVICPSIEKSERFLEKIPILNRLSWTILVIAAKV